MSDCSPRSCRSPATAVLGPDETRARIARFCDRVTAEPWMLVRTAPATDGSETAAPPGGAAALRARAAGRPTRTCSCQGPGGCAPRRSIRRRRPGRRGKGPCAPPARTIIRNGHLHAERVAGARLDPWAAGSGALARPERARDPGAGGGGQERGRVACGASAPRPPYARRRAVPAPDRPRTATTRRTGSRTEPRPCLPPECRAPAIHAAPGATRPDAWSRARGPRASGPRPHRAVSHPHRAVLALPPPAPGSWKGRWSYCARVFPAVAAGPSGCGPPCGAGRLPRRRSPAAGGARAWRRVRRGSPLLCANLHRADVLVPRPAPRRDAARLRRGTGVVAAAPRRGGAAWRRPSCERFARIDRPKAFQVDALERFLDELQGPGPEGSLPLRASVLGAGPGRLRDIAERYLTPDRGCDGVLAGAGREAELDRLGLPWRRL